MAVYTMSYNKSMLSGTSAERTAMTAAQLGATQYTFFESDTKLIYSWRGTEWEKTGTSGADHVTQSTLTAGEDLTNDVTKVEQRFSFTHCAVDTQVKAAAGFVHTLTFSCNDAAPTAGSITVYDSLSAAGTKIYSETFDIVAFRGYSVILDAVCAIGIYVDFTTTADVNCGVSWR